MTSLHIYMYKACRRQDIEEGEPTSIHLQHGGPYFFGSPYGGVGGIRGPPTGGIPQQGSPFTTNHLLAPFTICP